LNALGEEGGTDFVGFGEILGVQRREAGVDRIRDTRAIEHFSVGNEAVGRKAEELEGRRQALDGGVDPNGATDEQIESIFFTPDSLALELTPENGDFEDLEEYHRRPRYKFSVTAD